MRRMVSDKDIALLEDLESNNVNSKTISQLYIVDNIKAISGDILNKLKAGDIVLKNTDGQLHAYNVSFKKDGTGICLTYTDASVVETQSYDYTDGAWVYNSEDKTNIIYTGGIGININGSQISADTNVLQEKLTAGSGIAISDENVISSTAAAVYTHHIYLGSTFNNKKAAIRFNIESTDNTPFTMATLATYLNEKGHNASNKSIMCNGIIASRSGSSPDYVWTWAHADDLYSNGSYIYIEGRIGVETANTSDYPTILNVNDYLWAVNDIVD